MANKMRRVLAWVLVLALCTGHLALPVVADTVTTETVNPDGSVTVTVTTTTTEDGKETVSQTTTTVLDEGNKITEWEENSVTTQEKGVPTGNVQKDVLLDTDTDGSSTTTELPTETDMTPGTWENTGTADGEMTPDGLPTPEELGEPTNPGASVTETVTPEDPLKANDPSDDVTLTFTAKQAEDADTIVSLDSDRILIPNTLVDSYREAGYTVTPIYAKDENGSDTEEVIGWLSSLRTAGDPTTVTGEVTAGETVEGEAVGQLIPSAALDAEAAKGLQTIDTGKDNVKQTTEMVKTGGNAPTYTRTTTTVTTTNDVGEPVALTDEEKAALASSVRGESVTSYIYLQENEKTDIVEDDGTTTSYRYDYQVDTDGNILAYIETTTVVDSYGRTIFAGTEEFRCTTVITTPITITDPTTKQTTTITETTEVKTETITNTAYTRTNTTELERIDTTTTEYTVEENVVQVSGNNLVVDAQGNSYFVYEGKMYAVVDNGSDASASSGGTDGRWTHKGTYLEGHTVISTEKDVDRWGRVSYDQVQNDTQMFRIVQGNEVRYVYCVELDQYTDNANYQVDVFADNTTDDNGADWGDSIRQLRSVALNGFWNTDSGIGSLASVKSLLKRHQAETGLTDKQIEQLTAQEAITATQVALWQYGSPDDTTFGDNFSRNSTVVALRDLLVKLAEEDAANNVNDDGDYQGAAQEITGSTVTGAAITLKNQVKKASGEAVTDKAGNEMYNADVSFSLSVSESSVNGNLIVTVVDANGNNLGQYRLADDGTSSLGGSLASGMEDAINGTKQVKSNGSGTYTLENIQLPNGTRFTVNLSGTQHLDDGVTIYMNSGHQDFIGLVSKDKDVDVSFDMEFSASSPEYSHTTSGYTQTGTSTQRYTGTRKETQQKTDIQVVTTGTITKEETTITTFRGDVSVVEDICTETGSSAERTWFIHPDVPIDPPGEPTDPPGGGDPVPQNDDFPIPEGDDDIIIPDEEVPLAKAPKTGDISALWATLSIFSLGGTAMLSRKRKED